MSDEQLGRVYVYGEGADGRFKAYAGPFNTEEEANRWIEGHPKVAEKTGGNLAVRIIPEGTPAEIKRTVRELSEEFRYAGGRGVDLADGLDFYRSVRQRLSRPKCT